MGTFKSILVYVLVHSLLFVSCTENTFTNETRKVPINFENLSLNENLRQISLAFIDSFNLDNSIIEVTIDRKERFEPGEIYIILKCRGLNYFEAMKLKPMFTYEMKNNSFFVFTGGESLFDLAFDEKKFQNRRMEKCDESIKQCYWFRKGRMIKDEACIFPDPFSDLQMSTPPPKE